MLPRPSLFPLICFTVLAFACQSTVGNPGLEDASHSADANPPGADAEPPCGWTTFSAPEEVEFSGEIPTSASSPSLSADGLNLYFTASLDGQPRIWSAQRGSVAEPFAVPEPILGLGESTGDYSPAISPDNQTLYFSRRDGDTDLFVSTRQSDTGQFGDVQAIDSLNSESEDQSPWLAPDGLWALFVSDRGEEFHSQIWTATRPAVDAPFEEPQLLAGLDPEWSYLTPVADPKGLTLFFSTSKDHGLARGAQDIWMAVRSNTDLDFGGALPLSEINSEGFEIAPWLSADGASLYFYSNRFDTDLSDSRLYYSTRTCKP